jgi:glucose-1-phosphate thymidylyltransferase
MMRGVILAGGLATRLRPLTLVSNKHLLPVYNKPMIYYPLEAMKKAGIKEVLLTTSPEYLGQFSSLLKAGEDFGIQIYYAAQNNASGGIAQAINLAKEFAKNEPLLVILGDNIFNYDLREAKHQLETTGKGAIVFGVKRDTESKQYGVIEIDAQGNVLSIEEKPNTPKSDIAQTGIYMYDNRVFSFISGLTPSGRNELEVTDLNNCYLREGTLSCHVIDWWVDAGTSHDELLRANNEVARMVQEGKL